jgi:hypothetical protein
MAKYASEIMNPEPFTVRASDDADDAVGYLLALGITAAPVLDPYGKVVGFFSLRDALSNPQRGVVSERMSAPARSVLESDPIEEVGKVLAAGDIHHAAVLTDEGHVAGVVSTLDVLKAMLNVPVTHPAAFPHYDKGTGLTWSDDAELSLEGAAAAPDGPGLLTLISGGVGRRERVAWAEACNNVRTRVFEILSSTRAEPPQVAQILAHGTVRFRAASVPDYEQRRKVLAALLQETRKWMHPASFEEVDAVC